MATKPVHEVKLGSVRASVWQNDSKRGPMLAATFERRYKQGDAWKSSGSFSAGELANLLQVIAQAMAWMSSQPAEPVAPTEVAPELCAAQTEDEPV